MSSSALIIGGNGQIGAAAAVRLAEAGWEVTVACRSGRDEELAAAGIQVTALDRNDTDAVHALSRGRDAVIDVVAFTPRHGGQLTALAGDVGSLVVISTGAVYFEDSERGLPIPVGEDWPTLADQPTPDPRQAYGSGKAAMEQILLATPDLPVSILRPGTLHGPRSTSLHQWSFIKPVLDRRPHVVLAYDGKSRFSTSADANVAELIRLCAQRPGVRVLNAADDEALTVAEIGARIFALLSHECEIVTFSGPAHESGLGFNPWAIPHDTVLDTRKARAELGYVPALSYDEALRADIEWAVRAVQDAEAAGKSWREVFPGLFGRYGAQCWFPYEAEDAYVASLSARS